MECHSLQSLSSVKQRAHGNMSVVMRRETSRAPELAIASPRRKNGWFWWWHAKKNSFCFCRRWYSFWSSAGGFTHDSSRDAEVVGDELVGRVVDEPGRALAPTHAALSAQVFQVGPRRHGGAVSPRGLTPVVRRVPALGNNSLVPDHHDHRLILLLRGKCEWERGRQYNS